MRAISTAVLCGLFVTTAQAAWAQVPAPAQTAPVATPAPAAEPVPTPAPPAMATIPAGTPLMVATLQTLTTSDNKLGDSFGIVVTEDLVQDGTVVIPKGAQGVGEVTFVSDRGAFGKPGILQIKVVSLNVGDRTIPLDGRFRQEGVNKAGATAVTYFAVGIFAGFIQGKSGGIERGRILKARLAEPFEFTVGAPPPPVPDLPPPPPEPEAPAPKAKSGKKD